MLNRLSKKSILLLIAVVLFVGWIWLSPKTPANPPAALGEAPSESTQQSLVSAIQPVSIADAADAAPTVTPFNVSEEFTSRFTQANSYATGSDLAMAKLQYQDLIRDYPQAVEPYVNLAALYAQESQLDLAQQTLTEGINANQSYAALFVNLQKILGALAANAYRDALQEESKKITTLQLPLLQTVRSGGASSQQLKTLREQLQEVQAESEKSQEAALISAAEQQKVLDLQAELSAARQSLQTLDSKYQKNLADVQAKLDEQTLATSNLAAENEKQQSEIELAQKLVAAKQAEIDQAGRDAIEAAETKAERDALAVQLAQAEQLAAAKQAEINRAERDAIAKAEIERDAQAKQQAIVLAQQQARVAEVEQRKKAQNTQAIARVNSWARAWAAQSVSAYVSSYAQDYVPIGRGLNREQWLEQRRVRLTNKSFIAVDVSDFKVTKTAQGFDVTFLQHYRSDNIDDRIRKRLSFVASEKDWSQAKITRETIIK